MIYLYEMCMRSNSLCSHEWYLRILLIFSYLYITHSKFKKCHDFILISIYIHVPFYCLILIIPSRPILGFNKHSILNFYSLDSNVDIFAGEMRTHILLFIALCTHVCSPYLYRAVITNEKY